ncbi:hypothetical protein MC885_017380 [Smutsia gigantea]|nr:hypothetical protein MC885_017380 [Smutsia gigantea]
MTGRQRITCCAREQGLKPACPVYKVKQVGYSLGPSVSSPLLTIYGAREERAETGKTAQHLGTNSQSAGHKAKVKRPENRKEKSREKRGRERREGRSKKTKEQWSTGALIADEPTQSSHSAELPAPTGPRSCQSGRNPTPGGARRSRRGREGAGEEEEDRRRGAAAREEEGRSQPLSH